MMPKNTLTKKPNKKVAKKDTKDNTDISIIPSESTYVESIPDAEVYKGKKLSEVFKDYYMQLSNYEKLLLSQINKIDIITDEDFVIKSNIFTSIFKEINSNHKNKKEFIQSLLDYQIKNKQSNNPKDKTENPLNSVQNFMMFVNNIQDQKSEKQITGVVIDNNQQEKEQFLKDSEGFNPTYVFSEEEQGIEKK